MDESLLITRDNRVVNLKDDGTWEYVTSPQSSLDTWQGIEQTHAALELFKGLFDRAGVRILDTDRASYVRLINGDTAEALRRED